MMAPPWKMPPPRRSSRLNGRRIVTRSGSTESTSMPMVSPKCSLSPANQRAPTSSRYLASAAASPAAAARATSWGEVGWRSVIALQGVGLYYPPVDDGSRADAGEVPRAAVERRRSRLDAAPAPDVARGRDRDRAVLHGHVRDRAPRRGALPRAGAARDRPDPARDLPDLRE